MTQRRDPVLFERSELGSDWMFEANGAKLDALLRECNLHSLLVRFDEEPLPPNEEVHRRLVVRLSFDGDDSAYIIETTPIGTRRRIDGDGKSSTSWRCTFCGDEATTTHQFVLYPTCAVHQRQKLSFMKPLELVRALEDDEVVRYHEIGRNV